MADVRSLFEEYSKGLGIDLCFQGFDRELRELPGDYRPPGGVLLLALADGQAAGCCALRPLKNDTYPNAAEMKRLYVRPSFRGKGIGKRLVAHVLTTAKRLGYSEVLLDTLQSMEEARALYQKVGFVEIPSYYSNPIAGAHYLKLTLSEASLAY